MVNWTLVPQARATIGSRLHRVHDANAGNVPFLLHSRTGTANYVRTPDLNDTNNLTIGVNAAVCSDGTVAAAWLEFNQKRLVTTRSLDGGVSWGSDVVAHNYLLNTPS